MIRKAWRKIATKIGFGIVATLWVGGCAPRVLIKQETPPPRREPHPKAVELFTEGTQLEVSGRYPEALLHYQEAMIYDSTSASLFLAAGKLYLRLGREESAMHTLRRCVLLDPNQLEAHGLLAQIYLRQGWIPLVEKTYRAMLQVDSTSAPTLYQLAILYMRTGQMEKAEPVVRNLLKFVDLTDSKQVELLHDLGELFLETDRFAWAHTVFDRLIENDPEDGLAYFGKGLAFEGQQDTLQAIGCYEAALQKDSNLGQVRDRLGRLYESQSKGEEAERLYLEGIAQDSTDLGMWLNLGILYRHREDSASAARTYEEIVRRFAESWEASLDKGRFHLDWRQYAEAKSCFARVTELKPEHPLGWLFAGIVRIFEDSAETSIPFLEKTLSMVPEEPLANYYLGSVYMQKERYEEAEPYLMRAVKARPRWVSAMSALAAVWDALKKHTASDSLYTAALAIEPDNPILLNNFGYSLSLRGIRLEEAFAMSQKALEKEPENAAYLDTMGWIYFKMGNLEKAAEYIRKAVEKKPDNAEVIEHLGDVYEKQGAIREALEMWKKARDLGRKTPELLEKIERYSNP